MADTEVIADTTEKMSTEDISTAEPTPKEDITEEEPQPSKTIKEELLKVETEELAPKSITQETVDENGDVFEETTEVTRKVVKRTMKITETSSSTKTTTMTTPAKLYGKDLSEYDEVDVDALLAQLSPEEINILAKEVDPDDNFLPPNQRCSYECTKDPTGPLDRKKLIEHINKEAMETPDLPELEPYVKGTVRGKKWVPPPRDERELAAEEQIAIDMGDEYEHALSDATQEEIIDLAAILGFHSMMNQDQYHASLLNKGQPVGLGWDGITKSTTQKLYPMDPPNNTDVEESIKRVKDDDPKLIELNLNNIKNISDEKFEQLFDALPQNEHLEVLSLTNVGLTDKTALLLAEAIEKSKTLRVLNVETNFINPPVIVTLVKALLKARTIEEFRASNQRSTVLGNKIEMEITDLVEKNASLLRLGLHLEFNDARHRVAAHLQRNIDRNEHELRKGTSTSPIPNATPGHAGIVGDLSSMQSLQKPIKAKPVQSVLTPQERIDSKSDLIASLMSQKLSHRGRGEISLAVPHLSGRSRSPSKDRVVEPKAENGSTQRPVKRKEDSPIKPVEKLQIDTKPIEKKEEALTSPVRRPKIGELRHSNLSKAVDEESISTEENGKLLEPSSGLEKSVATELDIKDLAPTKPSEDETKALNDETLPKTPDNLQTNGIVPTSILDLPKSQIEVPSAPVTPKTSLESVESEAIKDQPNRNVRVSESISPSRQMEDKLTLLQAKIDSFAEVADEKLSSLRLKFDDIARDSSLNSEKDIPSHPKQMKESVKVDETVLLEKQNESESKVNDPVTLPPKIPHRKASLPKIASLPPLTKSPNSIGISFVFQKQIFRREESQLSAEKPVELGSSISADQSIVEHQQILRNEEVKTAETISEKMTTALTSVPPINENIMITDQEIVKIPQTEVMVSNLADPIQTPSDSNPYEPKPTISDLTKPVTDREFIKSSSSLNPSDALQVTDVQPTTMEVDPQLSPNIGLQITSRKSLQESVMSRLSLKKGESVHIVETKKVEAETQSPIQTPPLSRLSFKKGDPQTIDPVLKTEVGTQSASKPNPLSLLSLKKCDLVDIKPATHSEQSTQFSFEQPKSEASSQTVEEEPIKVIEETTQTPLVFSSLEHDYIFPGLRRVPHLPRPKTINIGGGDRVIIKPSSKPINEVLMLLYPVLHGHSTNKPQDQDPATSTKNFGLEVDLVKDREPEGTIKILEDTLQRAVDSSDSILNAKREPSPDLINQQNEEEILSIKTEIEIPLDSEPKHEDHAMTSHIESKFTAVEEVSAMSRTTIASEARVEVIDKAYKSIAAVSSAEAEQVSKTSIRSANMWESLSSNLIKASEQTLIDIAKNANSGESRTKIGKVSVYSSIEDLSNSSRSKYGDRHIGGLIKTVEKTSIYSSSEDLPLISYTTYSDRYGDERVKKASKSVYSSTEDLLESSTRTKYSERYANELVGKNSTENLANTLYSKDRSIHAKAETSRSNYTSIEDLTLLPASKFSDRNKLDSFKPVENQRLPLSFPVSQGSYYKFSDHSTSRSQYKSADILSYRTKINDRATHEITKSSDTSLQTAIMSSISRNQSALRPYTYVPTSIIPEPVSILDRSRPSSPVAKHTTTLQLNISPSGISELHSTRGSKYISKEKIDRPKIVVSRPKDEHRYTRAKTPIERVRPSAHLLSPHREISRPTYDHSTVESIKSTLDISSASAAITPTNDTINSTPNTPPKKRANIMDTIKMLKNRVRDVITTEDRFSETHRLPSHSSIPSSSTSEIRRAARANARMTSSSLHYPHDNDEKEI